jgi:subtilisin-like proprotein convertase family protein
LNFRLTVRDDNGLGGCSDHDDVALTVTASAGPFQVTSQNTTTTWTEAQNVTVTWNVANTTASPVSCALVDIYLSYDGGLTYPVTLLEDHPNDGSASFNVPPGTTTTTGRIMVKASGNVFFDINNANITINAGTPNYTLALNPATLTECNDGSVQTTVTVGSYQGFSNPVTLSAANLPPGATAVFTPAVVTPGNTSTLTVSNLTGLSGSYTMTVQGSASSGVQVREFFIALLAGPSGVPTLSSPANNATNVYINPLLTWSAVAGSTGYDYQIAQDAAFTQVVQSGNVGGTQFQVTTALTPDLQYFWRIRPVNTCGPGNWSATFSFTTTGCFLLYSPDVPKAISATGTPTVLSTMVSPIALTISDIDIIDLEGTHTWVDDLKFSLISPQGTERLFWDQPCGSEDNFDINFDDEAANSNWPCPPTNGQAYKPTNTLVVFDGQPSAGTWTMKVQDVVNQDGGSLNKWGLKVCGTPPCQLVVSQTGPSGPGSLRGAIECAQAGDTIVLSATLQGQSITIGSVAQVIGKDLTITAAAPDIGITGTGGRVFEILAGIDLVLDGMVLTGGTSTDGGAIQNSGNLVLQGVTVNPNPGVPGAVLIRNDAGAQLTIAADCQINQ